MEANKILKLTENVFTGIFFGSVVIFFSFFYNNHLHFEEQTRLFLFTRDFLLSNIRLPGGISGYSAKFLTQFYYLSFAGPLIIAGLLFCIQRIFRKMLLMINGNESYFVLSFLPSLNCALILCDEFYPLSAVTGFLISLFFAWMYMKIANEKLRFLAGLILIPAAWYIAGGSFLMLIGIMIVFELLEMKRQGTIRAGRTKLLRYLLYPGAGLSLPLIFSRYVVIEPAGLAFITEFYYDLRTIVPFSILVLFILPLGLILLAAVLPSRRKTYYRAVFLLIALFPVVTFLALGKWANPGAESIMKYDYLVRNERWNDVIDYAAKKPPRNDLSLAMLNLALAKTSQMGDLMFRYEQNGVDGLFLPFTREYVAPMMGSDILFNLGLINASQEYSFESMETIPDFSKSARCLKRLAETNLINGNYEVAGKYLRILEKTLFYRKWARETGKLLGNETLINNHPVYGEMRAMMIRNDFFFKLQNMESILNMLMRENGRNNMAFQYLMGFYMINKDLRNFMACLPMMDSLDYKKIPVSYQEAIMYVVGLSTTNPMTSVGYNISEGTRARMKSYADIYTTYRNARDILKNRFSGTYWYYLHYKEIDIKQ